MSKVTRPVFLDETGRRIADALEGFIQQRSKSQVWSLNDTELASGDVIEALGIPAYVSDISQFAEYGIQETGWYIFSRIIAKDGTRVTAATTVEGAAGYIADPGEDHVDIAVRFTVAALSQKVTINWGEYSDEFVFKATDLAVRNLDYRTTFYVYDAANFVTWTFGENTDNAFVATKQYYLLSGSEYVLAEVTTGNPAIYYEKVFSYALTEDTTFQTGKTYFTLSGSVYAEATVTAGEAVTAETYYEQTVSYVKTEDEFFQAGKTYYTTADGTTYTAATVTEGDPILVYYVHTKVTIEGLARNITYRLDDIVDCPMEFILPEIEDETHGCWFEIRCQHLGEYSMTLVPPSADVKIATEHTQKETAGINMIDLHYTYINGVKLWRFMNTHSSIPTT